MSIKVWGRGGKVRGSVRVDDKELEELPEAEIYNIYLPVGAYVKSYGGVAHYVDVSVEYPVKEPAICVWDKDKMRPRCNVEVKWTELMERAHPIEMLRRVLHKLKKEAPEYYNNMKRVVRGFSIDDMEDGAGAAAVLHKDGTCTIRLDRDTFDDLYIDNRVDLAYRIVTHELAHCFENYARRVKKLPRGKGAWVKEGKKQIPVGSERRAESFSQRLFKKYW